MLFNERDGSPVQVWSFDMKEIDPLVEEEDEDDEGQNLNEEKPPRKIGTFIKHDDYNESIEPGAMDEFKDLSEIERVFVLDHDFVCISRQRNEEFEQLY